jgi:hypothetical protein
MQQTMEILTWDETFEELAVFQAQMGHCRVYQKDKARPRLGRWVSKLRNKRFRQQLTQTQIDRLDSLGFDWETDLEKRDREWDVLFQRLVTFKRKYKTVLVPRTNKNEPDLGSWVGTQRMMKKRGTIRADRMKRLDKLGFVWVVDERRFWVADRNSEKIDQKWEQSFQLLVEFKKQNGHCVVAQHYEDRTLGRWVGHQRTGLAAGMMRPERKDRLDKLGFVWKAKSNRSDVPVQVSSKQRMWDDLYAMLLEFKKEHGHCRVPRLYNNHKNALGTWVETQREFFGVGETTINTMDPQRADRLKDIGFRWVLPKEEKDWDDSFHKLQKYKEIHGDCCVNKKNNAPLDSWVSRQLQQYKHNTLRSERKQMLVELGFSFADDSDRYWKEQGNEDWNEMFVHLKLYKEEHGDCLVQSSGYRTIPGLAEWVYRERMRNNKKILRPDRRAKLDKFGFIWHVSSLTEQIDQENIWNESYTRLKAYKQEFGDCMVPQDYEDDPQLASWVRVQRTDFVEKTLEPDRYDKLDAICFVWMVTKRKRSGWKEDPSTGARVNKRKRR